MSVMSSDASAYAKASRVPQIYAGSIIPTAVGSIFVLVRFYTRRFVVKTWQINDTLIAIAWVLSLSMSILTCVETKYGIGHHANDQKLSDLPTLLKISFALRVLYPLVLCLTKLGICTLYRHVFQDTRSRLWANLMISFMVISEVVIMLLVLLECVPIEGNWNLQPAKCISFNISIYAAGIFSVVSDIMLMAFLVPRIVSLNLKLQNKIMLFVIVNIGWVAVIAAIVRCVLVRKVSTQPENFEWTAIGATISTSVEVQTGLFCVSVPCLPALMHKIASIFKSSSSHKSDCVSTQCEGSGSYALELESCGDVQSHDMNRDPGRLRSNSIYKIDNGSSKVSNMVNASSLIQEDV